MSELMQVIVILLSLLSDHFTALRIIAGEVFVVPLCVVDEESSQRDADAFCQVGWKIIMILGKVLSGKV